MQKRYGAVAAIFKVVLLASMLSACGGGGSGDKNLPQSSGKPSTGVPRPSDQFPPAPRDLLISEVAANDAYEDVAWFELYNPSDAEISLWDYSLRSSYTDGSNNATLSPMTFKLPAVSVPAKGYLVVAGGAHDDLHDTDQIVYVRSGAAFPSWTHSGSIEVLRSGETVDFVRFGASTATPAASTAWTGRGISALPSSPNDNGSSIVRLAANDMADTNTSDDWVFVNFATPGGKNDVAPGVIDSDNDGIPDTAKVLGGTYGGLDVYAMGARPGRRDIFVEIDYDSPTHPRREVLQKVIDAFAQKNIALHFDIGPAYSASVNPSAMNLGGGNRVPSAQCIEFTPSAVTGCTSFYEYKNRYFDVRRRFLFHYALFGVNLNGPIGLAETFGSDMAFAMGSWTDDAGFDEVMVNRLVNASAEAIMHELGHNLGLLHGGNDNLAYKPNHYSIMNYLYAATGLSRTPSSPRAFERYRFMMGYGSICDLENSPCGKDFIISYSDGTGADLDENNLDETFNIGHGSVAGAYADWNLNGRLDSPRYAFNLNSLDGPELTVLKDYDEWGNLVLPFSRSRRNRLGIAALDPLRPEKTKQSGRPPVNPMTQRANRVVVEHEFPVWIKNALGKR